MCKLGVTYNDYKGKQRQRQQINTHEEISYTSLPANEAMGEGGKKSGIRCISTSTQPASTLYTGRLWYRQGHSCPPIDRVSSNEEKGDGARGQGKRLTRQVESMQGTKGKRPAERAISIGEQGGKKKGRKKEASDKAEIDKVFHMKVRNVVNAGKDRFGSELRHLSSNAESERHVRFQFGCLRNADPELAFRGSKISSRRKFADYPYVSTFSVEPRVIIQGWTAYKVKKYVG
ncbi:hypothetical protein C8F04DRAFT_1176040 [Mycena alexandri]|uniref:Uncharacterized protein n=1 Tax=Mycena alexandri TaxID=1745969 RepID=A0AAD6TAN7_9AGAR|nr:hypothetical protein C8F04DRAFT_1176040 [Mycena alexandri]